MLGCMGRMGCMSIDKQTICDNADVGFVYSDCMGRFVYS